MPAPRLVVTRGRRMTARVRVTQKGTGELLDAAQFRVTAQLRRRDRGLVLSGDLVPAEDGTLLLTFSAAQTGALRRGHKGVYEIVAMSKRDPEHVVSLVSGPWEVTEPTVRLP